MSFPYTGKKPSQLRVYDETNDGPVVAMVVETANGDVLQKLPAVGGNGSGTANLESVEIPNASTNGWLDIGQPIPAELDDFIVQVNGLDRNSQSVVEVDQAGQRIRVEDTNPFNANLQKVSFIAPA